LKNRIDAIITPDDTLVCHASLVTGWAIAFLRLKNAGHHFFRFELSALSFCPPSHFLSFSPSGFSFPHSASIAAA